MRPELEKSPPEKRAGGVAQSIAPEFKLQYHKKKKKKTPLDPLTTPTFPLSPDPSSQCPVPKGSQDPTTLWGDEQWYSLTGLLSLGCGFGDDIRGLRRTMADCWLIGRYSGGHHLINGSPVMSSFMDSFIAGRV
jgi:hypothetical protein